MQHTDQDGLHCQLRSPKDDFHEEDFDFDDMEQQFDRYFTSALPDSLGG
jgi:hypothetical protein